MGKIKYYCDYCDKSFNGDYNTRIKHLSSFKHIELRDEHYNNFKDPAEILREESSKNPCVRFHNDGNCRFGLSCKYSHYKPEELENLRNVVESRHRDDPLPNFNDWFHHSLKSNDSLPTQLSYVPKSCESNLPLSLKPFDVMEHLNRDLTHWGN